MKLKKDNTKEKLRGAYYTPLTLAEKMIDFFVKDKNIRSILEPSCGDGVFIDAALEQGLLADGKSMTAVEIEKDETDKLSVKYVSNSNIHIINRDFFEFYRENTHNKYDLIVGNPPYIRYQYLMESQRAEMSEILISNGMKSNKLINAWVGFIVACVQMLSDNGKIAFVIPAEILQVVYAEDLRFFLAEKLSKITLLTFEELVFHDIEQEVVVLIGEKGKEEAGIRIIELNNLDDLSWLDLEKDGFQKLSHVHEKWTKYFTSKEENELIAEIRADKRFQKLSDVALINVGITTGNNKYFSVNQEIVEEYGLQNTVKPLIGRSSHANSVYFKKEDWQKNVDTGKPAYLIDFPYDPIWTYPQGYRDYIEWGEENKQNEGYKLRIRDFWYQIPSVWVPDAFFLRRNNIYPKFVLNCCGAVSTDTMHRLKFYEGEEPERIVLSYYNSISFAFTEICGRSYGGGVLEILPGEVGNIIVPVLDNVPIDFIREVLEEVDRLIREGADINSVLDLTDQEILYKRLDIEIKKCQKARDIWMKLQRRRLKRSE